jgi:hypothetical protein
MSKNKEIEIFNNVSTILINNGKNKNQYLISSKHPLFKNEYIKVDINEFSLIFSVPTIDYNGKMYKTQINNNNKEWRSFTFTKSLELIISGKFYIDTEESTEDELVVYYR